MLSSFGDTTVHDNSPGGIAIKDRTLAYWRDEENYIKPIERKSLWRQLVETYIQAASILWGK